MNLDKCVVCKHLESHHARFLVTNAEFCRECLIYQVQVPATNRVPPGHKFKLDNLLLVEDMAKEKGLI